VYVRGVQASPGPCNSNGYSIDRGASASKSTASPVQLQYAVVACLCGLMVLSGRVFACACS
jgi:hypothetical protein